MNSVQCYTVKRYVLAGKIGSQVIHPTTWMPIVTIKKACFQCSLPYRRTSFRSCSYILPSACMLQSLTMSLSSMS